MIPVPADIVFPLRSTIPAKVAVPPATIFPLESIVVLSVIAPVVAFLVICLNPCSALTGPLKVVLAIIKSP